MPPCAMMLCIPEGEEGGATDPLDAMFEAKWQQTEEE